MNKLTTNEIIELLNYGSKLHYVYREVYPYWYVETKLEEKIYNIRKGAPRTALNRIGRGKYKIVNDGNQMTYSI